MCSAHKRLLLVASLMVALIAPATSDAHVVTLAKMASTEQTSCSTVYTVKQYRSYASRVYRRDKVSFQAQKKMRSMHICQHSYRARVAVGRHHDRYKRDREARACSNSNPVACAYEAAAYHGVSAAWLIRCAKSEGGIGPSDYDKPNSEGSGATGNWQFMSGTFWGYVGKSGAPKPYVYLSSEDQAYTAAYMFKAGLSSHWTGAGC